ncbi:MFS transporter [Marininema halotolerans]|nr:MFS transporter [Marininema halotolerans]
MRTSLLSAPSQPLWSRNFIFVCIANALVFFTFQLLLPTLPLFVRQVGGREDLVGLIIGIFTLAAVISRPWIGGWLDLRGRRQTYLVGLFLFLLTTISYLGITSLWPLLLLRVVHGFAWGAVTTTAGTVATDLIPPHRQGEGMSYYGLFTMIGVAFGPVIGLWVIEEYTFTLLFIFATSLIILAWFIAQKIDYPPVSSIPATHILEKNNHQPFIPKGTALPSFMALCTTLTLGAISTYLPLFAADRGITSIGLFFTVYAFAMVLSRLWAGKSFDQKGPRPALLLGLSMMILALILLAFLQNLAGLLLAAILYGFGFGSVHPSLQASTIQRVLAHSKGRANGVFFAAFDLGIGIGSTIAGFLVATLGYFSMFLLCIAPLILIFILAMQKDPLQSTE